MKYHVHVYYVTAKVEYDLEAEDQNQANQLALDKAQAEAVNNWVTPECNLLAMVFPDEQK